METAARILSLRCQSGHAVSVHNEESLLFFRMRSKLPAGAKALQTQRLCPWRPSAINMNRRTPWSSLDVPRSLVPLYLGTCSPLHLGCPVLFLLSKRASFVLRVGFTFFSQQSFPTSSRQNKQLSFCTLVRPSIYPINPSILQIHWLNASCIPGPVLIARVTESLCSLPEVLYLSSPPSFLDVKGPSLSLTQVPSIWRTLKILTAQQLGW